MKAQIVSFHCVLKNKMGKLISSTFSHDVITQGPLSEGINAPLKGLIDGLQNLTKGERRTISLTADKAYGYYDPQLVMNVSRRKLTRGEGLEIGQQIIARGDDGEMKTFRVVDAADDSVTLDGNHPLAGQDLVFDIEATEARDATREEIAESLEALRSGDNIYLH